MATTTYREAQHPRASDGKYKDKGWTAPKHRLSRDAKQIIGAEGLGGSLVLMLTQAVNLVTIILAVGGASLMAWGGYKGTKKRRKRRRRGVSGVPRFGSVRLSSEAQVDAYIKLKEWRKTQRRQRVAAAGRVTRATGHAMASGTRAVRAKVRTS